MTKKFLALIPLIISLNSFSAEPSIYLWDNQEGLISATSCEVIPSASTPFKVSRFTGWKKSQTENLRNYAGIKQSHLINGSIVKRITGKQKSNYKKVEVVGVNSNLDVKMNRWFSQRLDQGYLYKNSIFPIEDYIIEVNHKDIVKEQIQKITQKGSSFWLAEAQGSYYNLKCPGRNEDREYTLFRVYEDLEESTEPSAFVGVYWDETKIFSNIKTTSINDLKTNFDTFEKTYDLKGLLADSENTYIENEEILTAVQEIKQSFKKNSFKEVRTMEIKNVEGAFKDIVCVPNTGLNVRDESLGKVIFKAKTGEVVKKFQSFDQSVKELVIDGVIYKFIKVQFSDREESDQSTGWVAKKFIKQKSQCKYVKSNAQINIPTDTEITGIDDEKCCEFPTVKAPTSPYTSGMRKFNARRGGGTRSHAACDLYRYKDEPILSIAPGVVVRDQYYFYQGTYAIEVVHSGGFVARYGELSGKKQRGIAKAAKVKMGQRIGYMGKVNSNCCRPMLHFEIYSGKKTGALSQSGNKYRRRSDLLDPTHYLLKWEAGKF
ncbi:hypothetical protein A9Q84_04935 [Halobacteriovorax marinus]|uniref:M23ase beta-sheet core domain-containing protein n=1 Tax=Halobacteriovorax marinus TaxID=97084 RepID=A0A1Y5FAP1_9BACT|nr:hypothetical protein A9Q84_04935 [Halobacteriovorax marinus]